MLIQLKVSDMFQPLEVLMGAQWNADIVCEDLLRAKGCAR